MATMQTHHGRHATRRRGRYDPVNLAVLFIALVAIALMLIGVARGETHAWLIVLPTALAAWMIATMRR